MTDVVILADGEFPRRPEQRELLRRAATVVCCDGAADKLLDFGREPDWIVGDFDSVSPSIKARFADRLAHVSEQETNDLAKAFRFCRGRGLVPTAVLGASGGREDHLLGNLARFAEAAGSECRLYTERGYFIAFSRRGEFSGRVGAPLSIFSFDPAQKITSQGLKYPLDDLALPRWYTGTLNVIAAEKFTLSASSASPILLFFAD